MARIINGSGLIGEIRGSIGSYTFSRNISGQIIRNRAIPTNANSPAQILARNAFRDATQSWCTLTLAEKQSWTDFALNNQAYMPKMGHKAGVNGMGAHTGAKIIEHMSTVRGELYTGLAISDIASNGSLTAVPMGNSRLVAVPTTAPASDDIVKNIFPTATVGINNSYYLDSAQKNSSTSFTFTIMTQPAEVLIPLVHSQNNTERFIDINGNNVGFMITLTNPKKSNSVKAQNQNFQVLAYIPPPISEEQTITGSIVGQKIVVPINTTNNKYGFSGDAYEARVWLFATNGTLAPIEGSVNIAM